MHTARRHGAEDHQVSLLMEAWVVPNELPCCCWHVIWANPDLHEQANLVILDAMPRLGVHGASVGGLSGWVHPLAGLGALSWSHDCITTKSGTGPIHTALVHRAEDCQVSHPVGSSVALGEEICSSMHYTCC